MMLFEWVRFARYLHNRTNIPSIRGIWRRQVETLSLPTLHDHFPVWRSRKTECLEIPSLILERSQVEVSTRKNRISWDLTWFYSVHYANPGIILCIRPRPLPPNCLPTHYFLIISPFHSVFWATGNVVK
jgi:hypothetical protein